MPMPPLLPLIDWPTIFASGKPYADWIQGAENAQNRQKMEEVLASLVLDPQVIAHLRALPRTVHVIAIAEDWCGDVVRHVPALQAMSQATEKLQVRFITRGQHPDVFVRFLTNGGEAIPKFIFLSQDFVECGNWGPMPAACRTLISRGKACGNVKRAREKVHSLYEADADLRMVVDELLDLADIASAVAP